MDIRADGLETSEVVAAMKRNDRTDALLGGVVEFVNDIGTEHVRNVLSGTSGRQNPQRSGLGDVPLAVVGGAGS
jgi:hypothetical protein